MATEPSIPLSHVGVRNREIQRLEPKELELYLIGIGPIPPDVHRPVSVGKTMVIESNSVDPGENARIAEEDRHRVLADEHRRAVIAVLRTASTPISLAALATRVVDRNEELAQKGTDHIEHVAIGLHHNHLPLLADVGVISYDPETGYVDACMDLGPLTD